MKLQITQEDLKPAFTLNRDKAEADLNKAAEGETGFEGPWPLDVHSDADGIHRLINEAIQYGIVATPKDWEILVYPTGIDSEGYCKVAVWSWKHESCEVLGRSFLPWKLIDRDVWEGDDPVARSVETLDALVSEANQLADFMLACDAMGQHRASKREDATAGA